jgi:nitrogen fixation protein
MDHHNKPLLYSIALHVVIIVLAIVGMPYVPKKHLEEPLVLVEFAPVGALTQSPSHKRSAPSQKKALKKVQPQPEEPTPVPSQPTPPAAATPPAPAPEQIVNPTVAAEKKVEEKKPEEVVPPKVEPQDQAKPEESKPKKTQVEQKAVADNSKRKSTKTDKEEPKKKPKKDAFASVLDSVAKLDGVDEAAEDHHEEHGEKSTITNNLGPRLTISEEDAVRRQLQACWSVPVGAKDLEKLIIDVEIHTTPDGMVTRAEVMNRNSGDPYFQAAARRAVGAALNPKCNPLKLPRDKYEQWKVFTVRFDPRDML